MPTLPHSSSDSHPADDFIHSSRVKPKIEIVASARPLMPEGQYQMRCIAATFDWSKRWRKWVAILKFQPLDRKPDVCIAKFINLGRDSSVPRIGKVTQLGKVFEELHITALEPLVGREFTANVSTVKHKASTLSQRKSSERIEDRPAGEWYSVVRDFSLSRQSSDSLLELQPSNLLTLNPSNPPNPCNPHNPSNPHNPLNPSSSNQNRNTSMRRAGANATSPPEQPRRNRKSAASQRR